MNRDYMATRYRIVPGAVAIGFIRRDTGTVLECTAERRPITRNSPFASQIEAQSDSEEFILRSIELSDEPPANGDRITITDEAGEEQGWIIQTVSIEQRRTRYRCLCNKER